MRSGPISPALKFREKDMSCTPQVFANCFILPVYFRISGYFLGTWRSSQCKLNNNCDGE